MSRWNTVGATAAVAVYLLFGAIVIWTIDRGPIPFFVSSVVLPILSGLIVMVLALAWDYLFGKPPQPVGAFNVGVAGWVTLVLLSAVCVSMVRPMP